MMIRLYRVLFVVAAFALYLIVFVLSDRPAASETPVLSTAIGLNAASGDETTHAAFGPGYMSRSRETAVYIQWGTGVTSGVVEVETASNSAYTGTWAPLATVTFSGTAPKADVVQITGIHGAVRTRISTVVAGGTVTTLFMTN